MTSSGIEPATLRQCLNQLRPCVPHLCLLLT
jgi:hypothetical protein